MAALAKAVIRANEMDGAVNVIQKHSSDVTVSDSEDSGDCIAQAPAAHLCNCSALTWKPDDSLSALYCIASKSSWPAVLASCARSHISCCVPDRVMLLLIESDDSLYVQDMQQRADVIVTEIFDSELLGEGVLPSLQHALSTLAKVQAASCCHSALTCQQSLR